MEVPSPPSSPTRFKNEVISNDIRVSNWIALVRLKYINTRKFNKPKTPDLVIFHEDENSGGDEDDEQEKAYSQRRMNRGVRGKYKTWEENFHDLVIFKEENHRFPGPTENYLGKWLASQKRQINQKKAKEEAEKQGIAEDGVEATPDEVKSSKEVIPFEKESKILDDGDNGDDGVDGVHNDMLACKEALGKQEPATKRIKLEDSSTQDDSLTCKTNQSKKIIIHGLTEEELNDTTRPLLKNRESITLERILKNGVNFSVSKLERVELLKQMGVDFGTTGLTIYNKVKTEGSGSNRGRDGNIVNQESFVKKIHQIRKFKIQHKRLPFKKESNLGRWMFNQKYALKDKNYLKQYPDIRKEREELLLSVGLSLNTDGRLNPHEHRYVNKYPW